MYDLFTFIPFHSLFSLSLAPPRFMMEGDGVMSAHQAKEVHLECKANGDDPISIMWRRDGQELVAEPGRSSITVIREIQHVTSKFSIFKTQKSDSGRYECQASNPFGKSFYHIHLQIWGRLKSCYRVSQKYTHVSTDSTTWGHFLGTHGISGLYSINFKFFKLFQSLPIPLTI